MTNREWLLEELNKATTTQELGNIMWTVNDTEVYGKCESCPATIEADISCLDCFCDWLNEKHITPMPTLENGMFVYVAGKGYNSHDSGLGCIYNGQICYRDGGFDTVNEMLEEDNDVCEIIRIYKPRYFSFNSCDKSSLIWEA